MTRILDILASLGYTKPVDEEPIDVVSQIVRKKKPVSFPGITIEEDLGTREVISKSELQRQICNILEEYEFESNIPVTHRYWRLCNQYRNM